jgi:acyl carrier protein
MRARRERPKIPADDIELIDRIRGFVADALDCPVEQVGPDDHIYDTLGLDSLGAVAVFNDLSYHFGLPEPEPDLNFAELHSARRLAAYARTLDNA